MDENLRTMLEQIRNSAEAWAQRTGKAASKAAGQAGKTANHVVESTKVNLQIFDLNGELEALYKQVGRIVYDMHRGIDVDQEDIEVCLGHIDETLNKIERLKHQAHADTCGRKCPNCGRECSKEDVFCRVCGTQL